jgi:hypothetical protein
MMHGDETNHERLEASSIERRATVLAPFDLTASDPEVTPAFILLPDRRLKCCSREPVACHFPMRSALW